jgi:NADPH2:quinone reductase
MHVKSNSTMKAIRVMKFGAPDVLQIEDVPDLTAGPGQVVVAVHAAGVNPVETYIRSGSYAKLPALPYTPGSDGAGVILELGAGVSDWRVGQRVYVAGSLSGTYAGQTLCDSAHLHPLPDTISFAEGAALGVPYTTAHFALFHRGQAKAGETVLIHGATGGVGLATLQLARSAGLTIFATGGTERGRELLLREGAHHVFDHHDPGYLAEIAPANAGRGLDLIVEMLANVNLGHDLSLLAPHGRILVVGSRGPVEINPRELMARNADIRGVMLFLAPAAATADIHRALVAGLEGSALRPIIAREYPLVEAPQAHEAIMTSGAAGKIVLVP